MINAPAPQETEMEVRRAQLRRILSLVLALVTIALYLPVRDFEFNNYDDAQYVTKNPWVQYGLRRETIEWAFTSGYAGNWHPLTWLSHMLDWQIYGNHAGGHHLTSVVFHVVNVLLLFGLLQKMTGATWRPAFVAAVFGWHPLHVESVAWIAERKDVLSAFFGFLALWAWAGYISGSAVKTPPDPGAYAGGTDRWKAKVFYSVSLFCFVLGLMSKPMLVSFPLLLLLLDVWPFNRATGPWLTGPTAAANRQQAGKLILEKLPFLVVTLVLCVVTFRVQKAAGAMSMVHQSVAGRMANALHSYVGYLGKLFWPHDLAVPYLYPDHLPMSGIILAGALLVTITAFVCLRERTQPYLFVGWFWYVIMLVPVIGLVQVGEQAMADRYTYLPSIGITIMIAWGAEELTRTLAFRRTWLAVAASLALMGSLLVASRQIQYWRNSVTLFSHTIAVSEPNSVAHTDLGEALIHRTNTAGALYHLDRALSLKPENVEAMNDKALVLSENGRKDEAVEWFKRALKVHPEWTEARRNLGQVLLDQGRLAEAADEFKRVIAADPDDVQALTDLGIALARGGHLEEAMAEYHQALEIVPNAFAANALGGALDSQGHAEEAAKYYEVAIELKPDFAEAHNNLGALLNSLGRYAEAREQFMTALRYKPDLADVHYNLGNALVGLNELTNAEAEYFADLRMQTNDAEAHFNLAQIFAHEKDWGAAAEHYDAAIKLKPDFGEAHEGLADVRRAQGDERGAVEHLQAALRGKPNDAALLCKLAWILATAADPGVRDGAEAARLAELADRQSAPVTAGDWDTRAAVSAAAGRYSDAVSAAQKALALATGAQQRALAAEIQQRLLLYEAGLPFHESAGAKGPTP